MLFFHINESNVDGSASFAVFLGAGSQKKKNRERKAAHFLVNQPK